MSEGETAAVEFVEVLRLGNAADLAVVVSLLEGSTIRHQVLDAVSSVFGEGGVWPRVMVDRQQLDEARELLQQFL
ncbi:MAG: DUF2007 domain-containing protein [Candidatus Latescibacterota bacterium]